jgi:hypothetical protein
MSRRFVGAAANIPSNKESYGGVEGAQIGTVFPSMLTSLQENSLAVNSSSLYYDETLGSFNQPSFQKNFGIRNRPVDNCQGWAQTGSFTIDNDTFWNGPAMLSIKVDLKQRWAGASKDSFGNDVRGCWMKPSFFYSYGAGYAAVREYKMNLGGGAQYTLDRYANFAAIMASCFTCNQRYGLMKISGGGCILEDVQVDGIYGMHGSTATWGTKDNQCLGGVPPANDYSEVVQVFPKRVRLPVYDNWMIAIKTPHTNFNNPKIRRRPLDTALFAEPFSIEIQTAQFDEVCDSGVNNPLLVAVDPAFPAWFDVSRGAIVNSVIPFNLVSQTCKNTYRQYAQIFPLGLQPDAGFARTLIGGGMNPLAVNYDASDYPYATNAATLLATAIPDGDLFEKQNPLLSPQNLPDLEFTSVLSSMRLTNELLGAYNVLKDKPDQGVYYPFQHFVSQMYFVNNTQYGGMTMKDFIKKTDSTMFPASDTDKSKMSLGINVVVNPLTAMYIGVYREKDRMAQGVSKRGGYSPALFWNSLELPQYQISFGSEPLENVRSHVESVMSQLYEHSSTIQIPYRGGLASAAEEPAKQMPDLHRLGAQSSLYDGILRNAFLYEVSFVEMEPLRNEAFMQQTPSFLGENLTFSFNILPTINSTGNGEFDPTMDYAYLNNYAGYGYEWEITHKTRRVDSLKLQAEYAPPGPNGGIITNDQKGNGPNTISDCWPLNNDNLMVSVTYAQNGVWQMNPSMNQVIFARG